LNEILAILAIVVPYHYGVDRALFDRKEYRENGCEAYGYWSRCVDYSDPTDPKAESYSGFLVTASSTYIAIFDGQGVSVIPRMPEYVLTRQLTKAVQFKNKN
jgi:hypothetical protein